MTLEEYMAECKAICEAKGYDYEAMEHEACMATFMIDGFSPERAVEAWHRWLD